MELKGSKTEQNLMTAFAGESQARNKYDYFASKAKKEGYEQIAAIFQETALNEKEHAKLWFKELGGIGDTPANLLAAAARFLSVSPMPPRCLNHSLACSFSFRAVSWKKAAICS